MGPLAAIALIGGGILAVNEAQKKKGAVGAPYPETGVDVKANADQMGYDQISQEQAEAQGGLQAGQSMVVRDENGNVIETVVQTGEGAQIAQTSNGDIHVRESLDDQIEIDNPPVAISAIAHKPIPVTSPAPVMAVKGPSRTEPSAPFKAAGVTTTRPTQPNRGISNALFNSRMRVATRKGFIVPH